MIPPMQPVRYVLVGNKPRSQIKQWSEPLMLPVLKVISFSPLDQQLLRSLRLDHVTEMMCYLFNILQFDVWVGNL